MGKEVAGEFDYQSDRHCSKTDSTYLMQNEKFDYQSDRHCSKTIGPKSPLQRTVKTDWQAVSTLNKMQVNKPFTFMLILIVVVPVLQQENSRFLKKHLLENGLKIIFR